MTPTRCGRAARYVVVAVAFILSMAATLAVAQDVQPPTSALSVSPSAPNGSNGWYITDVAVTITRDEPGTTYYQWDGTAPGSWSTYSTAVTASEGTHTLYFYSEDTASNTEVVQSQTFSVDTVNPVAGFTSPSLDASVTGSVPVMGVASDTNLTRYRLEFGSGKRPLPPIAEAGTRYGTWWRLIADVGSAPVGGVLGSWDTSVLDNSYHTLRLTVWDDAGNTSNVLRAVKVDNAGLPWLDEVTFDPTDFVPDISPDGTKIAFSSDRLGNVDTWIATTGGSILGAVGTSDYEDRHPTFSPDGNTIAFMSNRSGNFDIWKVNTDNTGLTQLTSSSANEGLPTWSPDGTKIVYTSDAAGNHDICIMNANGSSQTVLAADAAWDYQPDISPDGSKVAFASARTGNNDIFIVNSDGTGLTQLTSYSSGDAHPSFSPDGQKLAFMRNFGTSWDVWTMNVDGSEPKRLTTDPAPDALPTWSSDGNKIVFSSGRSGMNDVYTMNPDGSGQTRLTFSVDDFIPDTTSDASRIAFTSNRARDYTNLNWNSMQGDLYLVDGNGSNMSLLTDLSHYNHHPSFSPDGQSLTFVSDESGDWDVWTMGVNGTGRTRRTTTVGLEAVPTWGPTGKVVYVDASSGTNDILIMNSDGSAQSAVTSDTADDRYPDILADGSSVGFSATRNGPGDLFTADPDGSNLTRLTPNDATNEWHPSFGPGGTEVSYSFGGANSDLYRMALDGSSQTRLTRDAAYDVVNTWSGDGKTIVFATSRTTGDLARKSIWKMAVVPDAVAASPDATPPVTALAIAPATPDGYSGWYVTTPTVTLTPDETGTTFWQLDATSTAGWTTYTAPFDVQHGIHTLYYYSADSANNTETVSSKGISVDLSDPSTPNVWVDGMTSSSIDVAWDAASDTVSGILEYRLYDAGTSSLVTSSTSLSATVGGLTPATSYSYFLRSVDVAGRESADSSTLTTATSPVPGSEVVPVASGSNVSAQAPSGVAATFDNVTSAGSLVVTQTAGQPNGQPDGFKIVGGGGYFDISFTGSFTGEVLLTLPYDDTGMSLAKENNLKLFHWKNNGWEDVTVSVDTNANTITGRTTSFSPFVITEPEGNVIVGTNVTVTLPSGVSVTFDQVTTEGTLTATPTSPAAPGGFSSIGACYDLAFSGSFTGDFSVTIPYDEVNVVGAEGALKLFHYTGGNWGDITTSVDTAGNTVTGQASSFSDFGVFGSGGTQSMTPASSEWSLVLLVVVGVALFARRRLSQAA